MNTDNLNAELLKVNPKIEKPTMTFELLAKHFPYETMRPQQEEALRKIAENWDKTKFFILELPTGVGKSGIGIAVGLAAKELSMNSIVSTPLKMLQDQYSSDFSKLSRDQMSEIKGRNNYFCTHSIGLSNGLTCSEGPGAINGENCPSCPYVIARNYASVAQIALMNTAYFMAIKYGPHFNGRKILIIDEAHSIPDYLSQFCEVRISNLILRRAFQRADVSVPKLENINEYTEWLESVKKICGEYISIIEQEIEDYDIESVNIKYYKQRVAEKEKYAQLYDKIVRYFSTKQYTQWI